jgi:hypothetical protein
MPTATVIRENIRYTTTLVTEVCCACQCPFAMPKDLEDRARKDHGVYFYCPNGHSQHYTGKTEEQKLRESLDNTKRLLDSSREAYRGERERRVSAERSATAYKGHATRLRKRVGNGVCPCCNRTFKQLSAHMERMHPGWADAEVTE